MRKYSKETFVKDLSDVIWMQVEMCENDDQARATFNSSVFINDYVTDLGSFRKEVKLILLGAKSDTFE